MGDEASAGYLRDWRLIDVTADNIEQYLRVRLKKRARVKTQEGFRELGLLKANHRTSGVPGVAARA